MPAQSPTPIPILEFCLYNQTRESFLTPRVTLIDAQSEPLKAVKVLIEGLAPGAISGLWLNPLKSIPAVPRLSAYDLVYLDREGRVVHGVELVPDDEAPRVDGAASALVLPVRSFAASQMLPGDQVILRPAGDQPPSSAPIPPLASTAPIVDPPAFKSEASPAALETPKPEPASAPLSVFTAIDQLQPFAWPLPLLAPQTPALRTLETSAEPQPISPEKTQSRFEFLRSIVRLRIRVQISISTAPLTTLNSVPAVPISPISAAAVAPEHLFSLDFSRAATQSHAATGAKSYSIQGAAFGARLGRVWIAFARRASSFATITLPIFFEHTLPSHAAQLRRAISASYDASKARYLRWADAFMFRSSASSSRFVVRLRFPRWFRA